MSWHYNPEHGIIVNAEGRVLFTVHDHAAWRQVEAMIALLREARREHSDGEDMVCATDYAAPERGLCDCGADAWNAKIDEILKESQL